MKTVTIAEPFEGYPDGDQEGSKAVAYAKGQVLAVPGDVSEVFADLIVGKGLATEGGEKPAPAAPQPAQPQPAAVAAQHEETHA